MKKVFFSLTAVLGVLLLTGCGSSNKVTCSAEVEESGKTYKGEIVAKLDGDNKVKDASITMEFETEDDASQYYSTYQMIINFAKQFAQEGQEVPEINIKKDGKKVIISDYAAFAKTNSEEESEELIGMSKEDFIKKMESDTEPKWTCK